MKKIIFLLLMIVLMASCEEGNIIDQMGIGCQMPDKLCALTFDDGPDVDLTPLVLDKLDKYNVKATFFMVGQLINDSTKPVVDRVVSSGHEIGNHSFSYDDMAQMSEEEVKKSVDDTTTVIEAYAGESMTPNFFRPPNLSVSSTMYAAIDLPFAGGVVGYDWSGEGTSAEDRANYVLEEMKDGAIILLHDVQPPPHPTPEALDILIPELKQQGYEFVTLTELFERKGVTPVPHEEKIWVYVE
jgi:peptidoglycan/xylan/chitin deacetylase (PgdA/CDA1 family)